MQFFFSFFPFPCNSFVILLIPKCAFACGGQTWDFTKTLYFLKQKIRKFWPLRRNRLIVLKIMFLPSPDCVPKQHPEWYCHKKSYFENCSADSSLVINFTQLNLMLRRTLSSNYWRMLKYLLSWCCRSSMRIWCANLWWPGPGKIIVKVYLHAMTSHRAVLVFFILGPSVHHFYKAHPSWLTLWFIIIFEALAHLFGLAFGFYVSNHLYGFPFSTLQSCISHLTTL